MENMYQNMYQNRGALVREEIRRTRHRSELLLYTVCILAGLIAACFVVFFLSAFDRQTPGSRQRSWGRRGPESPEGRLRQEEMSAGSSLL